LHASQTLRVAFAGTPEFALPALAALRAHHEVVGILTQPDRPSGRGRAITPGAVKQAALSAGLPLSQPQTLKGEAARAQLLAWRPEILVVAAYGLMLPREILLLPRLGCVNIHASLLPRWRGAAPIERALLAGDPETGVTIMQMDEGLDSGPVLLQRRIAIGPKATGGSLREALAALGADALIETLAGLSAGTLSPQGQPVEGITYAPKIEKAEARIDWNDEARHIDRKVRAFNPWPIAETTFGGEQLRVFEAEVFPEDDGSGLLADNVLPKVAKGCDPGEILGIYDGFIIVKCGHGCLGLTRVQRPGRRPVGARDFAHGLSLIGQRFG
jgi:methionyl-tRNA formyltransferase